MQTRQSWKQLIAFVVVAAVAGIANGQLVAVSQSRSVTVNAEAVDPIVDNPKNATQAAPGLDAFSGSVNVKATASDPLFGAQALASALQNSAVTATALDDSGSLSADSSIGSGNSASASGSSGFQVTFDLNHTQTFDLLESVDIPVDPADPQSSEASLSIKSASGTPIFGPVIVNTSFEEDLPVTLAPGEYVFTFNASTASDDESANSVTYTVAMSVQGSVSQAAPLPSGLASGSTLLMLFGAVHLLKKRVGV